MNLAELQRKLISAARANPPSDRVPYAFEQRIMAQLRAQALPLADAWAGWAGGLWRAAVPCVIIMLLFGAWTVFNPGTKTAASDFSQDLEKTVLAAVDQDANTDSLW